MKRRIIQAFIASLLASVLVVTPTFATTLEDMKENKAQAENEASSLKEQLVETLDKIEELENSLADKEEEVGEASDKLELAAAKQDKQYKAMKLRIKFMYEEGGTSFLEALFSAESFSDLLNKAAYVQEVHSYDRTKLDEYEAVTVEVEELKNSLEDEYVQMQKMQTELEEEKNSLSATLEEKQFEIAQLDQGIQEEITARQEAERKAREEAERAEAEAETVTPPEQQNPPNSGQNEENNGNNDNGSSGNQPYVPPQGTDGWAVVAYARQFLGNPYVLGGNSLTDGIDCSGFTQQIYRAFGVSLPRVDSAQATVGVEVPLSQAKAGDLLCYYGHVGIYNGSGGIIHASSPEVGIVEWSNCQYRTLKCVRRIL